MKSFYAELIDNMGVKIEGRKVEEHKIYTSTIANEPVFRQPLLKVPELETFGFTADKGTEQNEEPAKVISEVMVRTPHFVDEDAPSQFTSSNEGRPAANVADCTVFSSCDMRFYDGFDIMTNIDTIEFALADEALTEHADDLRFLDGHLAKANPLAMRLRQVEFANMKAEKKYPFIVMVAENDYGARACRVFLDLKRIATAGGNTVGQLLPFRFTLYCGKVGPKDGQLHEWPTPERCGFVAGGKIDAKRIGLACKKIAETMPSLQDYMNDLYADAVSAEVVGHKLTHEQLDVLTALWAEVYAG